MATATSTIDDPPPISGAEGEEETMTVEVMEQYLCTVVAAGQVIFREQLSDGLGDVFVAVRHAICWNHDETSYISVL